MKVIVVGAGIAGLAAAARLRIAGHEVVVLEANERPGGVVQSLRRDGYVLEQGAGSIRGGGPAIYQLLLDAGVAPLLTPASEAAKLRFLLHEGALVALPSGPGGLFGIPRLGRRGALRLLQEPLRRRGPASGEETVFDFLARRVGARAADALGYPLMAGITGGDPRQLEVDSTFPQWVAWERDHGSLVRGAFRERTQPPAGMPSGTFTVQGGVQTLIDALATQLGASLRLATPALSATFTPGRVAVDTPAGRFDAERLVIAAPPAVARQLLPDAPSGWLDDPPTAPLAAIHLGYPSLPSPPSGFGWLVHPRERRDALGCLWVSSTFPGHAPRGATLLRLMVGGARAPELAAQPDDALVDHARRVVAEVQGVHDTPALVHVRRTPIPQYPVGTARRLRLLHRVRPNVHFVGWWWGHMGIAAAAQGAADLVHALRGR